MATKVYKLYTSTTGSNNGVASLKITRNGFITAIAGQMALLGGAGLGRLEYEVSKQNTTSLSTNDTPDAVLGSFGIVSPNATHNAENAFIAGLRIPVEIGDTIYLNTTFTGAVAPAGANGNFYLYIDAGK